MTLNNIVTVVLTTQTVFKKVGSWGREFLVCGKIGGWDPGSGGVPNKWGRG